MYKTKTIWEEKKGGRDKGRGERRKRNWHISRRQYQWDTIADALFWTTSNPWFPGRLSSTAYLWLDDVLCILRCLLFLSLVWPDIVSYDQNISRNPHNVMSEWKASFQGRYWGSQGAMGMFVHPAHLRNRVETTAGVRCADLVLEVKEVLQIFLPMVAEGRRKK